MNNDEDRPIVPLGIAYSWTCPTCRQKNYVDPVLECDNPDAVREAFLRLGLIDVHQSAPDGAIFMQPTSVTCGGCNTEFEAEDDTGIPIGEIDELPGVCGCFEFGTSHMPGCPNYEADL